ncbi:snRNA-activating protein complex subunit 1 [Triplophysa tibetana]|uniref:snRNA-activating protein complex subunit 1 n=1 Tax=Triplophysa tibetana TaxID=1572043 RepID=A0A5A9PAK2_9TELE|nr:snRNA-activating protein complex subunit 1 [Triplophysa tibetana]
MDNFRGPLKTDCEEMLGRFQATESVRFERFSAIWKDINFSCIFYGKADPKERRLFARLALSVVSPYFHPPYTFQIRVGGLYLLYGLFHTQLCTPKEKIRIALKDWKDVMQFQQDAEKAQHHDVVYIFKKLMSEKAFLFTAMPTMLSCRMKRDDGKGRNICEEFVDPPTRTQELVTTDVLEELANVHEHYETLKKAVFTDSDSNVNLIEQNLVCKLNNAVLTYSNWQENRTKAEQLDAEEGPSNQDSSRRAQLLASIKSRSYGQVMEASKGRRHRQSQLVRSADGDHTPNGSSKKKRPPSLKNRTQLRFEIKVTPEAVGFLSAVGIFVVLLAILFLFINKKLCFARVGGLPCLEQYSRRKRRDRAGIHQGLGE